MNARRLVVAFNVAGALVAGQAGRVHAQCCLNDFFGGFHSCFTKAPQAYAVAPVAAPVMAPVAAPVPAPPPPVMVPVQQVSYVPETTYRTEYRSVPVTSYKPSSEIDPCTGCPRDCMEQVTNYVQQPVNVPVTQYRAVYSTKYVQMQPQQGYAQPAYVQPAGGVAPVFAPPAATAPVAGSAWVPGTSVAPGPAGAVASPFATPPAASAPSAWGAAGADIPQQVLPGQTSIAAPALQPGAVVPTTPQIVPQSGTFAVPQTQGAVLQPTAPPALAPAPSLRPITETPKTFAPQGTPAVPGASPSSAATQPAPPATSTTSPATGSATGGATPAVTPAPDAKTDPAKAATPPSSAPAASPTTGAAIGNVPRLVPIPALQPAPQTPAPRGPAGGMPTVPGPGPGTTTGAFPRLLAPTAHTTSWQPVAAGSPTAALPKPARQ